MVGFRAQRGAGQGSHLAKRGVAGGAPSWAPGRGGTGWRSTAPSPSSLWAPQPPTSIPARLLTEHRAMSARLIVCSFTHSFTRSFIPVTVHKHSARPQGAWLGGWEFSVTPAQDPYPRRGLHPLSSMRQAPNQLACGLQKLSQLTLGGLLEGAQQEGSSDRGAELCSVGVRLAEGEGLGEREAGPGARSQRALETKVGRHSRVRSRRSLR